MGCLYQSNSPPHIGHFAGNSSEIIQFKDSEFEVATATTIEEAKPIIAAGFECVTEKSGVMLFRKLRGSKLEM
jgi:hypothetical protein